MLFVAEKYDGKEKEYLLYGQNGILNNRRSTMLTQATKMFKIAQLQKGKTVKLSRADILDFSINLIDIKKRLGNEQYKKILELYKKFSKDREKIEMDLEKYNSVIEDMMKQFHEIENN